MCLLRFISFCAILIASFNCAAQDAPTIKFKKDRNGIIFFQKGVKSDTLARGNLFYLLVPDSLKDVIVISVENGRLETTLNDSLVTVTHFPGINYESRYLAKRDEPGGPPERPVLQPMINGASAIDRNLVRIRIIHKMKGEQLSNSFYYK